MSINCQMSFTANVGDWTDEYPCGAAATHSVHFESKHDGSIVAVLLCDDCTSDNAVSDEHDIVLSVAPLLDDSSDSSSDDESEG